MIRAAARLRNVHRQTEQLQPSLVEAVAVGAAGSQAVQVLILERGRGLTYTHLASNLPHARSQQQAAVTTGKYNMFGYQIAALGVLLVAACTLYAGWTLAVKLLSQ